jgi:hypothetical protein
MSDKTKQQGFSIIVGGAIDGIVGARRTWGPGWVSVPSLTIRLGYEDFAPNLLIPTQCVTLG